MKKQLVFILFGCLLGLTVALFGCGESNETADDIETPVATWYRDSDGDGYDDAANGIEADTCPVGFVSNKSDCNDADPSVYPGGLEIEDDGVEQDLELRIN